MSADYPNRKVWLAKRSTPRNLWKKIGRLFFAAGTYSWRNPKYAEHCNGNFQKKRKTLESKG